MIITLLLPALEKIINRVLQSDPDALAKIASIKNQVIKIHCDDWNITFFMLADENGLQFHKQFFQPENTVITGTLNNFLHIFIKGADTKTLFDYPIDINGNTHNIEILRDAFKSIDLDLEEKLSHYIGDVLAHKICATTKKAKKTMGKTADKLKTQISDYIYLETKSFPTRNQVESFYSDVAKLRNDVERLEAKIIALHPNT